MRILIRFNDVLSTNNFPNTGLISFVGVTESDTCANQQAITTSFKFQKGRSVARCPGPYF